MGVSPALALYLAWSGRGVAPFAERKLRERLEEGKEDRERLNERRGEPRLLRPEGSLIWFHAASVGESLAILELIRRLLEDRDDLSVLVTTGTVTSAGVMAGRLPERAMHQYIPLDARRFVTGFLDHWRPDVAVWTESELWPTLICETHARGIPMLMINARMSKTSHDKWRFLRGMAKSLLRRFDHALVQDDLSEMYLRRLGLPHWRMEVTGTLKEGAAALPCDEDERSATAAHLGGRPVWLAASTHAGEERMVLDAHRIAVRANPRLLLIIVPRHPERGDEIAQMIQADGWRFNRRTADELPDDEANVYLADTMGELGLWYRISPISFVGGSMEPIGGHNPFEPAALGSAILHGPYVTNFVDIYQRLTEAKAAWLISGPDKLAIAVNDLLNPDRAASMAHAAWEVVSAGSEITDRAVDLVLEHLDKRKERPD
ncbi:3-deoxy-D-manno-octulosonic-acid transferase [Roseibacterium elongatum DSM 19469]|uniref:3-deoxy-D-manno-octulosonic acid transferase n=1 Tax=Roseicyclus elongatus DSM 19469 TaxID=1294273 RepID=W8SL55_9RHOB|nr:3-deoxy-D-manno-octulosonic acid transferase [Roseibacterium elongatum]AHM03275.1 3-deoxy-D-manno-octulosonic-acid transferase [Roseibacterium elongatum DSM 19469]